MADIADLAQEQMERNLELALENTVFNRLKPKGTCYNCMEQVPTNALYCDADCGEDHALRTRP